MIIGAVEAQRAAPASNGGWEFRATPPRRSPNPIQGREDTRTLPLLIRAVGAQAEVWVDSQLRVRTSRTGLLAWLARRGVKARYVSPPLILRDSDMGVWFEIPTFTAPTILTEDAVQQIMRVLRA